MRQKTLIIFSLLTLVFSTLGPLLLKNNAVAQQVPNEANWLSMGQLRLGDVTFEEDDIFASSGGNFNMHFYADLNGCPAEIDDVDFDNSNDNTATLRYNSNGPDGLGVCGDDNYTTKEITLNDPNGYRYITGWRIDENTIWMPKFIEAISITNCISNLDSTCFETGMGSNALFEVPPADSQVLSDSPDIYVRYQGNTVGAGGVPDGFGAAGEYILLNSNKQYARACFDFNETVASVLINDDCDTANIPLNLANNGEVTQPPAGAGYDPDTANPGNSDDGASGSAAEATCESENPILGWLLCGILNSIDEFIVDRLGNLFTDILRVDIKTNQGFGEEETEAIYAVWQGFRVIANILFAFVLLIVIFGQSISVIEAYTLKKVMPRLVIAVIGVQLSWVISEEIMNFILLLGDGLESLLLAPFEAAFPGRDIINLTPESLTGGKEGLFINFTILAAGGAVLLGLFAITPIAMSIVLGILLGILVLVLRKMLLLFLVVVSPVAIVAWILPNTEKFAKMWFDFYIKALLMYPIIIGLFSLGKVFGMLGTQDEFDPGATESLIGIIAYFLPYFTIPFTFKFAGGVLATVSGVANDKSRGFIDKRKQKSQAKVDANRQKMMAGQRLAGNNRASKAINKLGGTAGAGWRGWKQGKKGIDAHMENASWIASMQAAEDPRMKAIEQNDTMLSAIAMDGVSVTGKDGQKRSWIDEKIRQADADGDTGKAAAYRQAKANAKNMQVDNATKQAALRALVKTGYQFADGEEGYNELSSAVDTIADGNAGMRTSLMNEMQYHAKNAGRADLGGVNNDGGWDADTGISKLSLSEIANGKKQPIKHMVSRMQEHQANGNIKEALKIRKELQAMKPYAKGANGDIIGKALSDPAHTEQEMIKRAVADHEAAMGPMSPIRGQQQNPVTGKPMEDAQGNPIVGKSERDEFIENLQSYASTNARSYDRTAYDQQVLEQ